VRDESAVCERNSRAREQNPGRSENHKCGCHPASEYRPFPCDAHLPQHRVFPRRVPALGATRGNTSDPAGSPGSGCGKRRSFGNHNALAGIGSSLPHTGAELGSLCVPAARRLRPPRPRKTGPIREPLVPEPQAKSQSIQQGGPRLSTRGN
jgi:hypothetical protein